MCISTEQDIIEPSCGSERQFIGYANALAERGHTVQITNVLKATPDWDVDCDICHIVNAGGYKSPSVLVAQLCKERGIPVVVSPVYWPISEVKKEIIDKMDENEEQVTANFTTHENGIRDLLREANWLLPNAEIELEKVVELLGGEMSIFAEEDEKQTGYTVIRNGIDVVDEINMALRLNEKEMLFDERLEEMLADRFVLCVGRIEVRKNQESLIEAMKPLWEEDPDLQLVLMGAKSAPYVRYLNEEVKGKNILFCPPGPPAAVMRMMRRCKAHALISLIETPGLVNLEAAGLNKPVVVADRGSVSEYLLDKEGVFYCDPHDIESITLALRGAMAMESADELGSFVRREYSYEKIAGELEAVYKRVIADKNP